MNFQNAFKQYVVLIRPELLPSHPHEKGAGVVDLGGSITEAWKSQSKPKTRFEFLWIIPVLKNIWNDHELLCGEVDRLQSAVLIRRTLENDSACLQAEKRSP